MVILDHHLLTIVVFLPVKAILLYFQPFLNDNYALSFR